MGSLICTQKGIISSSKTALNAEDFSQSRSPRDFPTTYNVSSNSSRAERTSTNNSQYRPTRDCFITSDVRSRLPEEDNTNSIGQSGNEMKAKKNKKISTENTLQPTEQPGIDKDVLDGYSGNIGLRSRVLNDEKTKSQDQSANKLKAKKNKKNSAANTIRPTELPGIDEDVLDGYSGNNGLRLPSPPLQHMNNQWTTEVNEENRNPIRTIHNQTPQDTQELNKKKKKKKKSQLQNLISRQQEIQIHEMTLKAKRVESVCYGEVHWEQTKEDVKEEVCPEEFLESMNNIERFIEELKSENKQVNDAAVDYQNRLSYVAGVKLRDNNPNITDLQDSKRPMKLADQYSKIYDDEWTDAMEELENMLPRSDSNHEKCVHHLFSLLKAVYKDCKERSERQLQGLAQHLFLLNNPSIDQVNGMLPEYPTERQKIMENRKQTAMIAIEMLRRTILEDENGRFYKEIKDCNPPLEVKLYSFLIETSYFSKCVEICWYFVIQDPPMYLETRPLNGTTVNKETHKEYTKSGTLVKYVVWPALYLHDQGMKGPLMAKGVVQPQYL